MLSSPLGRVLSSSVTSLCKRNVLRTPARVSFSSASTPKKSRKVWYIVAGGAAVLLGYATTNFQTTKEFTGKKKRLVVLGSGWAAMELVRSVDTTYYDVSVISPRNYFLFTPLLASASVGTVEFLSVVEPLRNFCLRAGAEIQYYEATCSDVFHDKNIIRCEEATGVTSNVKTFDLEYDLLVVAVGSHTSNMGIQGVQQNCFFLKDITDSKSIRKRIIECLETASYPNQTEEERRRLLHFVIVGGGPTGVEFSAELHDFVMQDIPKYYPHLSDKVDITLVQSADHILNTYDLSIKQEFKREKINFITNARVIEVKPTEIVVFNKQTKTNESIPCGMTVWATGVGPTPLTVKIAASITEQNHNKALVSDEFLRVKGILGDCVTMTQKKMLDKMVDLFTEADENKDGALSLDELTHLFQKVLPDYPHLQPFSHGLKKLLHLFDANGDGVLQIDEFQNLVSEIDKNLKSIPTTAQAASQAGRYLANSLNKMAEEPTAPLKPFYYNHMGSFAYVGGDHAVLDSQAFQGGGFGVWWLWRATYFSKQLSWRNRFSLAFDWVKTRLNGRNISKL